MRASSGTWAGALLFVSAFACGQPATLPNPDAGARMHTLMLLVLKGGSGSVRSAPAGIDCGSACSAKFAEGASIELTATAAPGWRFAGWGGACTGSGRCTVVLAADQTVSATFETLPPPPPEKRGLTVANGTVVGAAHVSGTGTARVFHAYLEDGTHRRPRLERT